MSPSPALSVVVPARNESGFIGACVESLQAAADEVTGLEIIVVDNGSTDTTAVIASGLGARVVTVQEGPLGRLRNLGATAATGRIIAFVDADCTVDPGWARHAVAALGDPAVAAAGCYPDRPETGQTWVQRTWSYIARRPSAPPHPVAWLPTANLVVDRERFRAVGGFDETMPTAEDADLCYRLAALGTVVYDERIAARHHREPRTLREFFRKEIWHGLGSYDGLTGGRLTAAEIPSLVAPLVVWAGWLTAAAGLAGAAAYGPGLLGAGVALTLAVPLVYTGRKLLGSARRPASGAQVLVLYATYHFARAISLLQWLRTARARRSTSVHATSHPR